MGLIGDTVDSVKSIQIRQSLSQAVNIGPCDPCASLLKLVLEILIDLYFIQILLI
jgi:hypothetical protein